jgi:putative ABC transport system ATP-binding protein
MNDPILASTDIKKLFGTVDVVKGASVHLQPGEFVSLVGKSGSGKTTLLSLLSGLERPTSGQVRLCGKDIVAASEDELALFRRANIGFIFQSFQLIPTLTAWENVAVPLFPEKMAEEVRRDRAISLLRQMELEHRLDHLPGALSGGEKQRVAIARALINHPKIIFADEPTGNLDSQTGQAIMQILDEIHKDQGMTILMVTHDLELSKTADRMLRMQDGEIVS